MIPGLADERERPGHHDHPAVLGARSVDGRPDTVPHLDRGPARVPDDALKVGGR